jgi:hypothetical protein
MRRAWRAAALTLIVATALGGTAAPASAQTDPTQLWSEYPLEPAPPRGRAKAALPGITPPAGSVSDPSADEQLLRSGLVLLFVAVAGGAVVSVSIFALRMQGRRSWY